MTRQLQSLRNRLYQHSMASFLLYNPLFYVQSDTYFKLLTAKRIYLFFSAKKFVYLPSSDKTGQSFLVTNTIFHIKCIYHGSFAEDKIQTMKQKK